MDLREIRDWLYGIWIATEIRKFHEMGGKVVMIVGSYGKTSVKELTYDLLRHKYNTVETARNYNTVVGIAKTLYYEVGPETRLLILEVGAYRVGEITRFCKILKPDIGVLTGIARQHLERFGSFEKIIEAKTEIVRYLAATNGLLIANESDQTVKQAVDKAIWYSGSDQNSINQNAAKSVALELYMSEEEIRERVKYFRQIPSRFEYSDDRYGMKVIDDSYNSNEKTFLSAVSYLGKQKKYTRILITPGILELGDQSNKVHEGLGKHLISNADLVILVGKNERTKYLAKGINKKIKIIWIDKTLQFIKVVKDLKLKKEPLVLIENDVPELQPPGL